MAIYIEAALSLDSFNCRSVPPGCRRRERIALPTLTAHRTHIHAYATRQQCRIYTPAACNVGLEAR